MLSELWNHAPLGLNEPNIFYEVKNAPSAQSSQEMKAHNLQSCFMSAFLLAVTLKNNGET